MKKYLAVTFFASMLFLVLSPLPSLAAKATPQNPVVLTYEFWLPNNVGSWKYVESFFGKLVEISGGAVKMEYHTGSSLGKPNEIYTRTLRGLNDIGHFAPGYTPGIFPMFEMFELPIHFPNAEALTAVVLEMRRKGYFKDDFSKVKVLSMYSNGPWILYTTKKKIDTIEDLKGQKLNSSSEGWVKVTDLLGGTPVSIFVAEHYNALQKGIMDGLWQLWDATRIFKMNEVCKYANETFFGTLMHVSAMNINTWNKLPDACQKYLEENIDAFSMEQARTISLLEQSRKAFVATPGNEIYKFSPQEMDKMSQRLTPIVDKWIADREKKKLPAKKAMDDLNQVLKSRPPCRILGYGN